MAILRLPPMPAPLRALRPAWVGAAARLPYGGTPLHQPPILWVEADVGACRAAWPALQPDPALPGHLKAEGLRVRPLGGPLEPALRERVVPLDAMARLADGRLLDPLDGLADLQAGRVQVPDPAAFAARPSLFIDVPALASELGVRLDPALVEILTADAGHVLRADRDALREGLTRLLVGRRPSGGLQLLARTGLLAFLLPEVAGLIDFHKSSRFHHKDVWAHTRQVVMQAVPLPRIRWAALLHDVGKTHTRSYAPGRKVHFFRHDELGAYLVEGIAARLRFPAPLAERVQALVLHHLRANLFDGSWSDAAIRRFDQEMGPLLDDLLALSRADVTSKRPGRRREAMYTLHRLKTRILEVRALDLARRPMVPKGLGTAIIRELGVAPGPQVGDLRRVCEEAVRAGELGVDPAIERCVAYLRAHLAEQGALRDAG